MNNLNQNEMKKNPKFLKDYYETIERNDLKYFIEEEEDQEDRFFYNEYKKLKSSSKKQVFEFLFNIKRLDKNCEEILLKMKKAFQ